MPRNFLNLFSFVLFTACSSPSEKTNTNAKSVAASPALEHGKEIFFGRCASCHMVNKELTGPALKGAEDRWPDKQKMYAFIRNSDSVIQTDKYARELWLQYNQTSMNKHSDLTDEDIRAIIDYIKSVAE
ncbi:MAG: c-type cytochrome [Chitinophagaceae bacterium]